MYVDELSEPVLLEREFQKEWYLLEDINSNVERNIEKQNLIKRYK